ncbi:ABC transporter ATP-binding protein [bacterium]|nr:ABC transporter ATP-binding protein [bacterium]
MLKYFVDFIKYYGKNKKLKVFMFLMISILAGGLEFLGIGLIYPFLIMVINPQFVINNNYYATFSNLIGINSYTINTIIIGLCIISMFILKNLLMVLCVYLQNKFVINWKNDINEMLMKFYLNVPYKKTFENSNSEKIYNLTVLSSQTLETFVLRSLVFLTNGIIIVLILLLMLFQFSLIALFTMILVILCMIFINKFFKHKTEVLAPKMLEYSLKNNNSVIENIKNLKEIRIFGTEEYFLNKFNKTQRENNSIIFKNAFYSGIPPYIVEMVLVFSLIVIAAFITYQNSGNTSQIIASYGLIAAIIFRIAPSLNRIQVALNHMNASKNMIKKINEEYEKNKFDEIKIINKSSEKILYNNNLKFENVSFEYLSGTKALKNISFEIKKGEFIGITGLSGAGKTTLADILTGLLQPNEGKIFVDENEINENNIYNFRKLIGYVPQEMNILEDTYKNNVAWGMNYHEINENNVKESLKSAQLLEFAEQNGGINSLIKGLSQGQKQRLLIARALYRNPEIILFDEATSSLDVETENEITQMLTSLKEKKTIIAIAHRLTTLKECDRLIYLKDGEIIDIDTFEELEKKYEDFKRLINLSKF